MPPAALLFALLSTCAALVAPVLGLADAPLPAKLARCISESKPPAASDYLPITSCAALAVEWYRLLGNDWHDFFVQCSEKKGDNPSEYEYWASDAADCVDVWTKIPAK